MELGRDHIIEERSHNLRKVTKKHVTFLYLSLVDDKNYVTFLYISLVEKNI